MAYHPRFTNSVQLCRTTELGHPTLPTTLKTTPILKCILTPLTATTTHPGKFSRIPVTAQELTFSLRLKWHPKAGLLADEAVTQYPEYDTKL
jgi:hypothetical protein